MLPSKNQIELIVHINALNSNKKYKISNDIKFWEELGIKSVQEFTEYLNFEAERQLEFFNSAAEISDEEIAYLERQADEFEFYRNYSN